MAERPSPAQTTPEVTNPRIVNFVSEVSYDGQMFLSGANYDIAYYSLEEVLETILQRSKSGRQIPDYFETSKILKGIVKFGDTTAQFESRPIDRSRVFIDAEHLSNTEVSQKPELAIRMAQKNVRSLVRTRNGGITEFRNGDTILLSKKRHTSIASPSQPPLYDGGY